MKILGDVWDEWDGTEFETTSRIGQFSDSSHTHLAERLLSNFSFTFVKDITNLTSQTVRCDLHILEQTNAILPALKFFVEYSILHGKKLLNEGCVS